MANPNSKAGVDRSEIIQAGLVQNDFNAQTKRDHYHSKNDVELSGFVVPTATTGAITWIVDPENGNHLTPGFHEIVSLSNDKVVVKLGALTYEITPLTEIGPAEFETPAPSIKVGKYLLPGVFRSDLLSIEEIGLRIQEPRIPEVRSANAPKSPESSLSASLGDLIRKGISR